MKRVNKNVILTMKHLEATMVFIEHVIQPQLFMYIYSNGGKSFTQKTKNNKYVILGTNCVNLCLLECFVVLLINYFFIAVTNT